MKLRGGIAQDAEQQKSYDPTNVKRSKSQGAEGGGEEKIDEPINTSSGKETGREASNTKTEKPKSIKKYDVNAREFKPREKPNLNQVHGQFPYQNQGFLTPDVHFGMMQPQVNQFNVWHNFLFLKLFFMLVQMQMGYAAMPMNVPMGAPMPFLPQQTPGYPGPQGHSY
mmetsp:Transcript_45627/g.117927  ORF Transcript_45627/g.117927 Transcript_45627/m.117927 type:complete len:168 (+) Transcript_45627:1072-1575(+)